MCLFATGRCKARSDVAASDRRFIRSPFCEYFEVHACVDGNFFAGLRKKISGGCPERET
jgi:hypothetical protein